MSTIEAASGVADIYDLASQFQRNLGKADQPALDAMSRAWGNVGYQAERDSADLAVKIDEYKTANPGQPVPRAWLNQQDAYRNTLENARRGVALNTGANVDAVEYAQRRAMYLAGADADQLLSTATGRSSFVGVRPDVVEAAVGFLQDGSPVSDLMRILGAGYVDDLDQTMVRAVANGWGPDRLAREIRRATGTAAARAHTVARTESMRLYRHVSHQRYLENSDVLQGWVWHSRRDLRCCSTCWAMGGTIHRLGEQLDGHPNCRCIMVPVTNLWNLDGVEETRTGTSDPEAAFRALTPKQRRQILGPGKAGAYERGEINLSDTVARDDNGPWGTMRRQASLKDSKANARARKAKTGSAGQDPAWRLGGKHGMKQPSSAARATAPKVPTLPTPKLAPHTGPVRYFDDGFKDALTPQRRWSPSIRQNVEAAAKGSTDRQDLVGAMRKFQNGERIGAMRGDIADRLAGKAVAGKRGRDADALIGAFREAPDGWAPDTVYRGMSLRGNADEILARYAKGSNVDLNVTSFTADRKVAKEFQGIAKQRGKGDTPVMMEVSGSKRMIPMENMSPDGSGTWYKQREWIGAGQFRVVEAKQTSGGILLRLEQVGTL